MNSSPFFAFSILGREKINLISYISCILIFFFFFFFYLWPEHLSSHLTCCCPSNLSFNDFYFQYRTLSISQKSRNRKRKDDRIPQTFFFNLKRRKAKRNAPNWNGFFTCSTGGQPRASSLHLLRPPEPPSQTPCCPPHPPPQHPAPPHPPPPPPDIPQGHRCHSCRRCR